MHQRKQTFSVKVIANSKVESVTEQSNHLKVKVMAVAVGGAANKAVIRVLARYFGVKRQQITITSGETSPTKIIDVSF